ncbi:MAG: GspE/PulE family protein [Patescibacteria group bacterium]
MDIDKTLENIKRTQEEQQARESASIFNIPYINLVNYPIAPDVMKILPLDQVKLNFIIPYIRLGRRVRFATSRPENPELFNYLSQIAKEKNIEASISAVSETSFNYALSLYEKITLDEEKAKLALNTSSSTTNFEQEIQNLMDLREKIKNVSTTQIVDVVFTGAKKTQASDIHVEPTETDCRIRYRIDGVLQDIVNLPNSAYQALNSRIKFLSGLKMDQKKEPQDGRFSYNIGGEQVDVRVSTLPTNYGEAIVMRLLSQNGNFLNLDDLGFSEMSKKNILDAIKKPNGMILNTGPTGSGKTTTLYALLSLLNKPGVKIITLENPIEYRLSGIEQVQVSGEEVKGGMTFSSGLRSILRQDPDIIMVGEIRDLDTADIAIRSAMTGHLVLSTLHTNNAPAAYLRLVDMGLEPFLLQGSINLIIAQRLVRKVHQECGGKGCDACNFTGYKGRIVISETLKPTPDLEKLIYNKAPLADVIEKAKADGMQTMTEDGMEKVKLGLTTKEEVERVISE